MAGEFPAAGRPYENEVEVVRVYLRGDAGLVVTEETGRNRFREWNRELVTYIPIWLIGAGINMYVGVARAGYTVAEEAPIFLRVFAVPAILAALLVWRLSRG